MQKIKIGVLMGGKSIEREVSFNSGRTVCDHLDTESYEIIPLFQTIVGQLFILPWRFLHRGKISDFEHRLPTEAESISWDSLKNNIDFIFNAMNGRYGEDGSLQGLLEILGIPYLGSKVFTSALGMDKFIQKDFLKLQNIITPKDVRVYKENIPTIQRDLSALLTQLEKAHISFPCIVKPRKEGSSLGISVVHHQTDLFQAIKKASEIDTHQKQDVLIEKRIDGMEFTCIIIINKNGSPLALPPTEIIKEETSDLFDYAQKYMPGRSTKFTPARCDAKQLNLIQSSCINVMNILGMQTIARIDGFLTTKNEIVIIDPNTLSGMAPSSFVFCQAAQLGMNHATIINHLIETEIENYHTFDYVSQKKQGASLCKV